jgi:hypothetical protein
MANIQSNQNIILTSQQQQNQNPPQTPATTLHHQLSETNNTAAQKAYQQQPQMDPYNQSSQFQSLPTTVVDVTQHSNTLIPITALLIQDPAMKDESLER